MSTSKELWMRKRCLQPNAHHQVSPLLTNGLDTTGLGDCDGVCEGGRVIYAAVKNKTKSPDESGAR